MFACRWSCGRRSSSWSVSRSSWLSPIGWLPSRRRSWRRWPRSCSRLSGRTPAYGSPWRRCWRRATTAGKYYTEHIFRVPLMREGGLEVQSDLLLKSLIIAEHTKTITLLSTIYKKNDIFYIYKNIHLLIIFLSYFFTLKRTHLSETLAKGLFIHLEMTFHMWCESCIVPDFRYQATEQLLSLMPLQWWGERFRSGSLDAYIFMSDLTVSSSINCYN